MSLSAESKSRCLALLFAWPAAVAIGWGLARLTHTDWPAAALPIAWLGVLFWSLRRVAAAGDYASRSR